jgi:cytohesin
MDGDMDLCAAALFGDIDKIGEILKKGADPNAQDTNGLTPLLYAVREERTEIVYLLLKNGADPNAKDTNEQTPLLYAIRKGRAEALHLLLKNGADPNAKDTDGRTPLLYAAQEERTELLHLLLKNGADPNTKDTDGRTPLLYAAEKGRTEAVYLLLKNGADPNIASKWGITARYDALYRGNNDIVRIFDNPPAHVQKEVTKYPRMQVEQKEPQENNIKRLGICKHFQSYVRYFGKSRVSAFSTVYDIIYSHRLEKFSRPQQPQQQSTTEISKETVRWFHLPIINVCQYTPPRQIKH